MLFVAVSAIPVRSLIKIRSSFDWIKADGLFKTFGSNWIGMTECRLVDLVEIILDCLLVCRHCTSLHHVAPMIQIDVHCLVDCWWFSRQVTGG